jgi:hypothetical protein
MPRRARRTYAPQFKAAAVVLELFRSSAVGGDFTGLQGMRVRRGRKRDVR